MPFITLDPPRIPAIQPRADERRDLARRLLLERCRLQARQALLEPVIGLPLIAIVVSMLHGQVPRAHLAIWACLLSAAQVLRATAAARFLSHPRGRDPSTLASLFNLTAGLTGLLIGACASLFFAPVTHADRLILTNLVFAWLAGSVMMHAAFPRHALLHGLAILAQLAVAWSTVPASAGLLLACGVVLYGIVLARLSIELSATLGESLRGRHRIRQLARRLAAETALARRADRASSQFLAAASHDLRQPATSLGLLTGLLRERCRDDALLPLIAGIDRSSAALNELLSNLLDLSRLEAGLVIAHPEWIDLGQVFEELRVEFEPRTAAKGLSLVVRPLQIELFSDRVLLLRILRNLLDNALRYTDQGSITLSAVQSDSCELSVSDTGIGIAAEHLEQIFEDHFQVANPGRDRTKGLGIGLAMVRRIAALLDSAVIVQSDRHHGSRFSLRLNTWRPSERPPCASPGQADTHAVGVTGHLLLVEDDADVGAALRQWLSARGWVIEQARNARDAVDLLRGSPRFQVMLTDYQLEDGADGVLLAQTARLLQPGIACLLLSGDTSAELTRRAAENRLVLVHKPVTEKALSHSLGDLDTAGRAGGPG